MLFCDYRKNPVLFYTGPLKYFHENTQRNVKSFNALIVDDQPLVRQGLMLVLKQHFPDIKLYEAGNGEVALKALMLYKINIVLLDIGLPVMGGVEIAETILKEYPNVKVLIVTQYNGEAMIKNLLKTGVHSFFLKNSAAHEINEAVTAVLNGKQYIPEALKYALIPMTHIPAIAFSKREAEILLLLKMGRSSKEISERLQLTEYTISSYREDMLKKTKTGNVAQLISYAYENGILG
jgi:DNA-binding NarL/FixJ family response regulator